MEVVVIAAFVLLFVFAKARSSIRGTVTDGGWSERWNAAAHELDLSARVSSKQSTMRGEIDGHRVSVSAYRNSEPEIEVRFQSGLRSIDISPRNGRTSKRPEFSIGDPDFESTFAVRLGFEDREIDAARRWFTPQRREIITVLNDALEIDDLDENELEVKLRRESWTPDELAQAVRLCVLVAKTLDQSYSPQDRTPTNDVREGPQDAVRPPEFP